MSVAASTAPSSPENLTLRQLEVAKLIDKGLTYAEIGAELGISARTAKAHTQAILHKTGIAKKRLVSAELREQGVL